VLQQKCIHDIFPESGLIVDKTYSRFSDQFRRLPAYVSDFLVSEFVKPINPGAGIKQIELLLRDHFVDSEQRELIKSRIREHGSYALIGHLRCRYDEGRDEYWAEVAVLSNPYIRIAPHLIAEYGETLLTTGVWGTMQIIFDEGYVLRNKIYPFLITDFRPMQITNIDLDKWIDRRNYFNDKEWVDLLISTIGFDPDCLTEEEKILHLIRLVPFVESNVNLIELGPTETGKTFTCQSLSSYGFVISGSQTTAASLFYDKLRKRLGIIGQKDVVMFDEFSNNRGATKWGNQSELVDMLKDFMNSSRFGRGTAEFSSGCSLVFAGNIDCDREKKQVSQKYHHLFAVLPAIINQDRAFLDRINGFIPGWRIGQIRQSNLAKGFGFMADYFGEIMHRLRNRNYASVILGNVDFGKMSQRNQRSIVRISSGLLKLIFPHKTVETISKEELKKVLCTASDLRKRVLQQLAVISPKEFGGVTLEYNIVK